MDFYKMFKKKKEEKKGLNLQKLSERLAELSNLSESEREEMFIRAALHANKCSQAAHIISTYRQKRHYNRFYSPL